MNTPFPLILDGSKNSSPHLVEHLPRQDPFAGKALCGAESRAFTSFGRSVFVPDDEVCEECMEEAKRRWRGVKA